MLRNFLPDASDHAVALLNHGILSPLSTYEQRVVAISEFNALGADQLSRPLTVDAVVGITPITVPGGMSLHIERAADGHLTLTPKEIASIDVNAPEDYEEPSEEETRDAA